MGDWMEDHSLEIMRAFEHQGPLDECLARIEAAHSNGGRVAADAFFLRFERTDNVSLGEITAGGIAHIDTCKPLLVDGYRQIGIPEGVIYLAFKSFKTAFLARLREHSATTAIGGHA